MKPTDYLSEEDLKRAQSGPQTRRPIINTEGRKVLLPLKAMHKVVNGQTALEITSVCIEDQVSESNNEGAIHSETFYLSKRSLWRLSKWCLAMGHLTELDEHSEEDVEKVFLSGPFIGIFKTTTYNEKERVELKYFNNSYIERDANGQPVFSEEQKQIIADAENHLAAYFERRINNGIDYKYLYHDKSNPPAQRAQEYGEAPF